MSSPRSENHLDRLLDEVEDRLRPGGSTSTVDHEDLIFRLSTHFPSAVESAGPGRIPAALDRLDDLLETRLRTVDPVLYGICLALRALLSEAVARTGSESELPASISWGEADGQEAGHGTADTLVESVTRIFDWAGFEVRPAAEDSALGGDLLEVEQPAGPLGIHALVWCVDDVPKAAEVEALAERMDALGQERRRPYRGVIVCRTECKGPSLEAYEHRIEWRTESRLLASLLDTRGALALAEQPYRGSELEKRYVEQEILLESGEAEEGAARDLGLFTRSWLDDEAGTFFCLLGDFGVGKTSFSRRLAAELAAEWEPGRRLPVLMDLREHIGDFARPGRVAAPEEMLQRHFRSAGVRAAGGAALLRLCHEGQLVLLLDGFGEMIAHTETGQHLAALRHLLSFARGRAKVIMTCRTHYFRNSPEDASREGAAPAPPVAATPLFHELRDRPDATIAYLREFDAARIETYLRRAAPDRYDRLRDLLETSYHLENLSRRPFLLRMILEVLPRIGAGKGDAGLAGLYESYCGRWLRPEGSGSPVDRKKREQLAEELARRIWRGVEERVDHRVLASWLGSSDGGSQAPPAQAVDDVLRRAPFLHRDGKGRYAFVHRSFLEFFLARSLRRGLSSGLEESFDLPPLTREVAFFLECWREASAIPRVAGGVLEGGYRPRISENALLLLIFHARSRLGPLLGPGAEEVEGRLAKELPRAFSTVRPARLRLGGADLTGTDLRGLDFTSADLRQSILERADLRHCHLEGADLFAANLLGADLRRARLEGADLEEADLRRADLRRADIRLARCARADFTDAQIEGMVIDGAGFLATKGLPQELLVSAVEVRPVLQTGHSWRVCDVDWHPELPLVASAGEDGTVLVWEASGDRLLRRLSGHGRAVSSVAWDPAGRRLASGSDDRTVRIWDAETGDLLHLLAGHEGGVADLSWDGEGGRLASASEDHTVRLWDTARGTELRVLHGHSDRVNTVAWEPRSGRLASGSDDWTARLWDANTGESIHVLAGHSDAVHSLDWSPGGRRLASGSDDWTVRIWNPKSGRSTRTLSGHSEGVHAVAWHPSGERLASGAFDRVIRLWDADTGRALEKLVGHSGWVRALSWNPSGRRLASGASSRAVRLWDVEARRTTHRLAGFAGWKNTVAWDPEGRRLVSGTSGQVLRVWSLEDGSSRLLEGHGDRVHTAAWDPAGKRIASGADDRTVRIWNAATGETERVLEGHAGWIRAVVWSPDGHHVASGADDRIVRVWDAESGECRRTFDGHSGWVRALAWDPADRFLASGADDGTVKLWNVESGRQIQTFGGHGAWVLAIAWDPAGRRLASGTGDGQVRVWDVESGRATHRLEGHDSWIHTVAWNPAGKQLLTASVDGRVRISDPLTGACLHTLEVGFIWHAAWWGDLLALAVPEGRIALWSLKEGEPRQVADLWGMPEGGLVVTDDGYVEGDPEALHRICFVDDGWAVYDFEELPDRHDRERVLSRLRAAVGEPTRAGKARG